MTMRPELEVYLTTYDGAQHLRLHGWLKRNSILIKSETINKSKDHFGMFMIYVNDEMLDKLRKANIEQGMYCDMDIMGNESNRLDLFKRSNNIKFDWGKLEDDLDEDGNFPLDEDGHFDPSRLENLDKFSNGIKSFIFIIFKYYFGSNHYLYNLNTSYILLLLHIRLSHLDKPFHLSPYFIVCRFILFRKRRLLR